MCHADHELTAPARGEFSHIHQLGVSSEEPMPTLVERAQPGRHAGAVLLITDIYGASPFYRGLAARLAEAGYTTAVPDFLVHQAGELQRHEREVALERARRVDQTAALADIRAVLDWLRSQAGGQRLGVLGFCLGGTFALDLAAERDDLGVVSFYGFPEGVPGNNPVPAPLSLADRITGPVLAMWGEQDYMGMASVIALCERIAAVNPQFESALYPEAGHGFLGGLGRGEAAAQHAWKRTQSFLSAHLDRARISPESTPPAPTSLRAPANLPRDVQWR